VRFCRFNDDRVGVVRGDGVVDVSAVLEDMPTYRWPLPHGDQFMAHFDELRPKMQALAEHGPVLPLASVRLLSPIANPGKIVAAPVNYKLHLDEARTDTAIHFGNTVKTIDEAGVFLKATSSLIGPSQEIVADWTDRRIDHEVELAVIIGRKAFRVSEDTALDYVAGYAIGLDITIRGPEERSYRKSLDTFSVLGPWVVTSDELPNPNALALKLDVDGEPRQDANTALLIFNVQKLIAYASRAYTLYPGDIIMTGTPEGVGPILPGNTIHAEIESIGQMTVKVSGA